tara:strand:+ start:349 stop:489 length:141 start_codon:yes stop_codon:yes gene_type:complete
MLFSPARIFVFRRGSIIIRTPRATARNRSAVSDEILTFENTMTTNR